MPLFCVCVCYAVQSFCSIDSFPSSILAYFSFGWGLGGGGIEGEWSLA